MMFLNGIAMIALSALAVPIIIHLRKRRKAKVVDWAAMQFLTHSLVNRRRGLALEHLMLLLCRCLLIAMFVLAMARPQITSASDWRWFPALLLAFFGLLVLVWAVVIKTAIWKRIIAGTVALLLVSSAAAFTLVNQALPQWDQARDVAIVIDASSSMNVEVDGKSNFHRAGEEANLLVNSLPGGSTVSVVVAGPVISSPLLSRTNLRQVTEELIQLEAIGGGTDLRRAIEQSHLVLRRSPNDRKQIVVFSDNQIRPWQQVAGPALFAPAKSTSDTSGIPEPETSIGSKDSEQQIELFCRALPLPSDLKDVSVTGLELETDSVSIYRPVQIVAQLMNGGAESVHNLELELLVDGKVVVAESVPELESKSRTSVRFQHKFEQSGWNTLAARLKGEDQLSDNDIFHRVVHVAADLPVLLVNGATSSQSFRQPATLIQLALDPASLEEQADDRVKRSQLTKVTAIDAAEFGQITSLADYQVILLCDVPRLPSELADRLVDFVERGGGMWVLPGRRCQLEFYNAWSLNSSTKPVLPMRFIEESNSDKQASTALGLDFDSVAHETLDPLLESGQHDLSEFQVSTHWKLDKWPTDQPVQVAARLTNGDPLLVEHSVGRGRVLLSAISFDSLESNLISRVSFPVLTHRWVEHLANAHPIELNHQPQRDLLIRLDAADLPHEQPLTLVTPNGTTRPVISSASEVAEEVTLGVGLAAAPGVYQITAAAPAEATVPFTVLSDQEEFDLTAASESKLVELGQELQAQWITDVDQIEKVARGSVEAVELWKYFAAGAMAMLGIEVIVMRWISWRRGSRNSSPTLSANTALQEKALLGGRDLSTSDAEDESEASISPLPHLVEAVK